jgi:hypothetical protein
VARPQLVLGEVVQGLNVQGLALAGLTSGVSNPEISDLTRKQPQQHQRNGEDFVPGEDILSL